MKIQTALVDQGRFKVDAGDRGAAAKQGTFPGNIATNNSVPKIHSEMPKGVLSGIDSVRGHTGIADRHLTPIADLAKKTDTIIAVRDVSQWAKPYIDADLPTKGFHIKGKSASTGPFAGLIPVDQQYSKLSGRGDKVIAANKEVQSCIKNGYAKATQLVLSQADITRLIREGAIEKVGGGESFTLIGKYPGGVVHSFEVKKEQDGANKNKFSISQGGRPVEVLSDPKSGKPLTADYDLMFVAPHIKNLGPEDRAPNPDVSHKVFSRRMSGYSLINLESKDKGLDPHLMHEWVDERVFYRRESAEQGNVSPRMVKTISALNNALGCKPGLEVVQHGADQANPGSDPKANYPVTLFLPKPVSGLDQVVLIKDSEAMSWFARSALDEGYQIPRNPLWEPQVSKVRRPSFDAAITALDKKTDPDSRR